MAAGNPRPESITVYLNADGVRVASKTVTPDQYGKWTYTFENMPKFANGQEIVYTVTEETVEGYTFSNGTDYNIVNTYTPGKTSVTVTKAWEDGGNQDGIRPASILVQLKIKVLLVEIPVGDPVELNAANQWAYTFTNLDDTYKGVKISYTVAEVNVPAGYEAEVTGNQTDGYTITNTHTPAVTSVSVEKDWSDENDLAGFRPDSVQVQLYKTVGQEIAPVGSPVTLSDENHWEYTWQNLPAKEDGVAISYTVGESEVEHYTSSITGNMKDGFTITNTHVPQRMAVTVSKTWDDNNDEDDVRPDSIVVFLLRNSAKVDEVELGEDNNWTYTFTNLPVYVGGEAVNYTAVEPTVLRDYWSEYEYTQTDAGISIEIINHLSTVKPVSVSVKKDWSDENDLAGFRPDSVQVQLYKTVGQEIAPVGSPVTLSDENHWEYTWQNLPAKEDGVAISYTVGESEVEHYTSSITGNMKDGFTITNTHVPQRMAVTVFKTWDDNSNEDNVRPDSVKVTLRRNGTRVGEVTLSEENDWTHTFTNLPVYTEGEVANYTVTETSVNNYQAEYEYTQTNAGMSVEIINHYTPAKTSIDVTKKWTDSGNKAGARPSKVTIYLLANGEKTGDELILTKENNWTGSFEDLPVKKDGKTIVYTISEKAVANYTAKITGNAKDGFVVTNTHVSIPTTGDESNMTMYAVLFSLGAMAVVSALILSRKKYGRRG